MVTATLLAATTLNFLDRQSLSVLAPVLKEEMGLTSVGYSTVVNSFCPCQNCCASTHPSLGGNCGAYS